MMPTLDAALLCNSRAGTDLGRESGLVLNPEQGFEPGSLSECHLTLTHGLNRSATRAGCF